MRMKSSAVPSQTCTQLDASISVLIGFPTDSIDLKLVLNEITLEERME